MNFWATARPRRTGCAADAFGLAESRARAHARNGNCPGHASAEMNAHYTHHEIETLRSAIGKLPTVRP